MAKFIFSGRLMHNGQKVSHTEIIDDSELPPKDDVNGRHQYVAPIYDEWSSDKLAIGFYEVEDE